MEYMPSREEALSNRELYDAIVEHSKAYYALKYVNHDLHAPSTINFTATVSAEVHCTYVFGIGGLSNRALMSNAISKLTQKADLQGSQALINISVKTHNKLILVWSRRSMVAQGTVIEFIDKNNPNCSEDLSDNTRLVVGQNLVNENSAGEEKFIVAGKSSFEQKLLARKSCQKILDDIENNQIDSAKHCCPVKVPDDLYKV